MGCDGGTIPKRSEVVKNKERRPKKQKGTDLWERWGFCSISGCPLQKPIVACQMGRLYNKDAVIESLLKYSRMSPFQRLAWPRPHVTKLRDVKELNLKEKTNSNDTQQASTSGDGSFKAEFVCPITGLEMNGIYKFFYVLSCGCVLSERALKEVQDEKNCIVCSKPCDPLLDFIQLNPDDKELQDNQAKFLARKLKQKIAKNGLLSGEASTSSSQTTESSDTYKPTTSTSSWGDSPKPSTSRGITRKEQTSSSSRSAKRHKP